ncbi:MAG: 6-hydroxymethylpterin diphosphokinase MptE-like protein [Phycisphaeraceae bacterium]
MPDSSAILEANLAALARSDPALVARLHQTSALEVQFQPARSGLLSATVQHEGRPLQLASRFDPLAEAAKTAASVDLARHAGIFVLGMGLGYHVAHIAARLNNTTMLIVYEPDIAMLRAVLETVDHAGWLGLPNVVLLTGEPDRGELLSRVDRFAAMLTQGTVLVAHPPTRQLHPQSIQRFGELVTEVLAYCRTHVATALVNAARTVHNLASNLRYYAAGANTNDLHQAARGYPAVCVGAGPSLAKNVDLLRDPALRANVVVITAQTTLKPLLDRGITPDFVTALDYHEISRRFYEGLPELPTVTLIAEPKAHESILASFPGPIRVTHDGFLSRLLGPAAPRIVPIRSGATVAHLSFYLAQHLGCDPIILIGQDLGFSDGLYYCPGTAIHDVWAPELGPFNTLEMMEWQRIVRHRGHLQKLDDIHGRPIYSDEQMITYLKQFERDFAEAPQVVIDASEGGLPKDHTMRMTLAEALQRHATRPVPHLPLPGRELNAARLEATTAQLQRRVDQVRELRALTRGTAPLLRQIQEHQRDYQRVERLFRKVEKNKARVDQLQEAFELVGELNTIGTFNRARADRSIHHTESEEFDRQRRRLDRDLENLKWLEQACDEFLTIFAPERVEPRPTIKESSVPCLT